MAARNASEREAATGYLGISLEYPDGSWLAICYNDSHHFPRWSAALALDSQGVLYRSKEHFCGLFSIYKDVVEQERRFGLELGEYRGLKAVATSPNLEAAREHLLKMGFRVAK